MPFLTDQVTDERHAHTVYVRHQLEQLRISALGLDDAQLKSTPTASALSLAGLLTHAAQTVTNWLRHVHTAGAVPQEVADERGGVIAEDSFDLDLDGFFSGAEVPEASGEKIHDQLAQAMELVEPVLGTADYETRVPIPDAPWFPQELGSWNVRWVAHHLTAELSRHAGHADILREAIDGEIAYSLNARDAGEVFDWEAYRV